MKKQTFLRSLIMVSSSNVLLLLLGIIISFVLPAILSISEYGIWQKYLYYSGFVGFFMLGFNDGMNIRYAGKSYDELDFKLFNVFLRTVILLSAFFMIISIIFINLHRDSIDYPLIFIFVSLNIMIFNINGFCIHLNQMTMRFRLYSISNVLERVVFVLSIPMLYFFSENTVAYYIVVNIICRLITMIFNLYYVRDIILVKEKNI